MTLGEANAINVVLRFLYAIDPVPQSSAVLLAARELADRANAKMHAGLRAEDLP